MTRPVMPGDESFEYILTQAVADYLANMEDCKIDGIIYPSIQAESKPNIVLFHKASRGNLIDRNVYKIDALLRNPGDGSLDFMIHESKVDKKLRQYMAIDSQIEGPFENRNITLSLDLNQIRVDKIVGVDYRVESHSATYTPLK